MKDYGQIVTKICDTPWQITEGGLRTILQIVESHINGSISIEEIRARTENGRRERGSLPKKEGTVGVLPLHGPIFPKANLMTELSGATSLEQFTQDFRGLLQDERVDSILLDVDSPGGSAAGLEEIAYEIFEARNTKPIYSIANGMAGSAAYYIASQASEMYASDSSIVGSIGTYMVHTDDSELKDKVGVKQTVIKEGRFKAAMLEPLTEETHAHLQNMVTEFNGMFLNAVARGRNTSVENVVANYGEGGVLSAKQALEVGMVDGIRTFDEVLGALLDGGGTTVVPNGRNGSSGFSLRASLDKEKEHSEPGSGAGGEPQDRIPPEDEHIDKWNRGERLHRPPNIPELEDNMNEVLLGMAAKLGIEVNQKWSDAELSAAINAKLDSNLELVSELEAATVEANKVVEFAKAFPEQAEKLRKLEEGAHLHEAASFASRLADFKVTEGEGDSARETTFRLSALAQNVVKETHVKLSANNLVHADLETLIKAVATGGVEQGERGSSRQNESDAYVGAPTDRRSARQQFAARVSELMQNDNLDRKAAIAEASKRYPELATAYREL